jgi:hypothetical protein
VSVLNSIGVNEEQFLDMGLLAGCDLIGTFVPVSEEGQGGFNFNSMHSKQGYSFLFVPITLLLPSDVIKIVRENGSGALAVHSYIGREWVNLSESVDGKFFIANAFHFPRFAKPITWTSS